jgi:hypothetical protein
MARSINSAPPARRFRNPRGAGAEPDPSAPRYILPGRVAGNRMGRHMTGRVQQFIDALGKLEADSNVAAIAGLFADGADISNPLTTHQGEGQGGAAAFWTAYRGTFDTIVSRFRNRVETGDVAILEWVSDATIRGAELHYGGVSVLEFGTGGIVAFRAYFDTAKLDRQAQG